MLIPVELVSFSVDPATHSPVIVLKEQSGQRTLAIAVGHLEASSIALTSLNVASERPLTIDLVKLVMEQFGGRLQKAVIYDLVDNAFLSRVHLASDAGACLIECRVSDAIALAQRCGAPLFVHESVFEKQCSGDMMSEKDTLKRRITAVDTLEFGTYYVE
jgi:hypothetical protein